MTDRTINGEVTLGGASALLANRYRVVRQLGRGGMGSVWLAEDVQLDNRKVAVKMLPSVLVSNKRAYNQLKAEALVSLKLTHPNIATVRAFEENAGNPFLVVDYIDGVTLDEYLAEKGKLTEGETIRLLKPIASALDYAHGECVSHRDVKPGNVMIRRDGHPFILDFGIAREIQETMTRVTGKLSSGTLMYMSPEQLDGDAPTAAQDVYSFAAMAYECLTGNPPFCRGAIEDQIRHKAPPPITSSTIGDAIMLGLDKNPARRPATCDKVLSCVSRRAVSSSPRTTSDAGANARLRYMVTLLIIGAIVGVALWYNWKVQQDVSAQQAEIARLAEEKKALEIEKRKEQQRLAEEKKALEIEKRKEQQRLAEEKRKEQQRLAEEKRKEQQRLAEEQQRLAEAKAAEKAKAVEKAKAAEKCMTQKTEGTAPKQAKKKQTPYPYEVRYQPYYFENGERKNVASGLKIHTTVGLIGRVEQTKEGEIAVLGAVSIPSGAISVTFTCDNRKGRVFVSSRDFSSEGPAEHYPKEVLLR